VKIPDSPAAVKLRFNILKTTFATGLWL